MNTCAYCGLEIDERQTFRDAGETYCWNCYDHNRANFDNGWHFDDLYEPCYDCVHLLTCTVEMAEDCIPHNYALRVEGELQWRGE